MVLKLNVAFYRTICLIAIGCAGCRNTNSQLSTLDVSSADVIQQQEPLRVLTDSVKYLNGLRKKVSVVSYYQQFGSGPLWIKEGKPALLADSLMMFIRNVPYYGLTRERYHFAELISLHGNSSNDALIRRELLMTDAFLCLAADLRSGLSNISSSETRDSVRIDLLHRVISNGKLGVSMESQEPVFEGYKKLKRGLAILLDSLKTDQQDPADFIDRIRLVSINLERWRNEHADPGQRYIFINIPSYMLDVVEQDSVIFSSKVIVGTPDKETPIVSSTVQCFTIYPYWHVPRKIAVEEYLPVIKKDTTFLTRNNFEVFDKKGTRLDPDSVAWSKFHENYFPVTLRQREGPENSLGIIKFIFDNPYAVYLHDTNAKRLFRSKDRAFSHGCIRMERAIELAHYLVTEQLGSESKTVSLYLKEKQQHRVNLKKPVPIYTRYFTCEFRNGKLHTYRDVYQKDKALYDLLYGERSKPDL